VGKLFAPLFALCIKRVDLPEQHPQPGPCEALYSSSVLGACALRSLTAMALRFSAGVQKKFGAFRMARGDDFSHVGQSWGASHSDIGRMSVNGPQSRHR